MLFSVDGKINSLEKEGAGLAKFCAVVSQNVRPGGFFAPRFGHVTSALAWRPVHRQNV